MAHCSTVCMQVELLENNDMQFEYDPERLIEEVRKRPGIWDFEDSEYRAKNMRHKLWTDVITELMESDVKVSKSEMRELELQLQKKWKSIRDCFQKYITNPNRTKRPYIYTKQLQFLLKNQAPTPISHEREGSSESEDTQKYPKVKVWKSKKKLKISNVVEASSDSDVDVNYDDQEDTRDYSNDATDVIAPKARTSKIDEFAFANVDAPAKVDSDDCDRLFLLSLLPHIKSIPEEFRLSVKMELLQVLRNANYNTDRDHKII